MMHNSTPCCSYCIEILLFVLLYTDMKNGINIVDLKYLNEKVIPRIAVKWYDIGMQLKIPSYKLDNIRNETDHITQRCLQMLQMWLQRSSNAEKSHRPTWENMYNAMIAIELIAAAETLKKEITNLS